jgi:hypothetical protein
MRFIRLLGLDAPHHRVFLVCGGVGVKDAYETALRRLDEAHRKVFLHGRRCMGHPFADRASMTTSPSIGIDLRCLHM